MWRLSEKMHPGIITPQEKNSQCTLIIKVMCLSKLLVLICACLGLRIEYACVFGISHPIPGLRSGEHINRYGDKFCIITFHGKGDRVFWFIIQKFDRAYAYSDAPRCSPKDAAMLCKKLYHVVILGTVTVGDLWEAREVASMTSLEEGLFQTWHFDRIVLLGDSVHKVRCNWLPKILMAKRFFLRWHQISGREQTPLSRMLLFCRP